MIKNKKIKFFVAGTDTEVGKTYVSVLLAKFFRKKGLKVGAFKPVESGVENNPEPDYIKIAKAAGDVEKPFYTLSKPIAPFFAAKYDNIDINIDKIIEFAKKDSDKYDVYIVEGAGGLFVPVAENEMIIDIIEKLGFNVILVGRTNLGTVNHTLLSIEALERRKIIIKDIILNEVIKTGLKAIEENVQMIEMFSCYKVNTVVRNSMDFKGGFEYLI